MVLYFGASVAHLICIKGKTVPTLLPPWDSDEKQILWCICKNSANHKRCWALTVISKNESPIMIIIWLIFPLLNECFGNVCAYLC